MACLRSRLCRHSDTSSAVVAKITVFRFDHAVIFPCVFPVRACVLSEVEICGELSPQTYVCEEIALTFRTMRRRPLGRITVLLGGLAPRDARRRCLHHAI